MTTLYLIRHAEAEGNLYRRAQGQYNATITARGFRQIAALRKRFENEMMDLSVNIPLERALDLGWEMLADCFEQNEVGIKTDLIEEYWPKHS